MSCTNPIYALNLGTNPDTGKMKLKILPKRIESCFSYWCERYGESNIVQLPCGKCPSCIEAKTKTWASRCVLEASLYPNNSFITLTYRDGCLPKYGLCKKDVQKFLKRLRRYLGEQKIRYYCCGEYGEHTKRPHYHLIIFGWFPEDAKFFKKGDYGEGHLYTSKILEDLWPFGFSMVGEVTYASCGYVARYCQKKMYINGKYKAFSLMSLKPGIGYQFLSDNFDKIYDTDKVYGKFGNSTFTTPFRYFDKVLELHDPQRMEEIKNERISRAKLSIAASMLDLGFEHIEQLYAYKGELKKLKMERLKRKEL
ncbi:MAG: hypothetical protein MJ214_05490 [Bacilli bacterium]|nr:hypothetical protein [Bacilli bacterium]